jgi:transcriptional regulator with XRE-family HTH domain
MTEDPNGPKPKTFFGELEQDRYRRLVDDLEQAYPGETQAKIAERLGIKPDHLARVRKGTRRVSKDMMITAAQRLGFDSTYFTHRPDATPEQVRWTDFRHAHRTIQRFDSNIVREGASLRDTAIGAVRAVFESAPEDEIRLQARMLAEQASELPVVRMTTMLQEALKKNESRKTVESLTVALAMAIRELFPAD